MEVDPKNSELTREREGEALTRAKKKAKKSFRADVDSRHGCGFRGTKAGPLSQHEAACKRKSEDIQKSSPEESLMTLSTHLFLSIYDSQPPRGSREPTRIYDLRNPSSAARYSCTAAAFFKVCGSLSNR